MSSAERVKRWRQQTKKRIVEAMGGKCQCCGYDKCHGSLALHHLDPNEKDLSFAAIRANPKSWGKIVVELRKCILVCHNCHAEIHSGIRNIPKTFSKFDEKFSEYRLPKGTYDFCVCGNKKPKINKYCGSVCAGKHSRKVDWDNIDLLKLMEMHSISELEKMLGVSNSAIYKRKKKILQSGCSAVR